MTKSKNCNDNKQINYENVLHIRINWSKLYQEGSVSDTKFRENPDFDADQVENFMV